MPRAMLPSRSPSSTHCRLLALHGQMDTNVIGAPYYVEHTGIGAVLGARDVDGSMVTCVGNARAHFPLLVDDIRSQQVDKVICGHSDPRTLRRGDRGNVRHRVLIPPAYRYGETSEAVANRGYRFPLRECRTGQTRCDGVGAGIVLERAA